ncbi:hypothetical protein GOODEAATRI_007034 [Goodea atripinnis]|uniref:Uncharacterized protein n=1 Tax=Goodea atripinnis TaxID=208336 RepID=A0ABV0NTK5_9TELE
MIWSVAVYNGTKRQTVPKGRGHVPDFHVVVVLTLFPTPLLESLQRSHRATVQHTRASVLKPNNNRCLLVLNGVKTDRKPQEERQRAAAESRQPAKDQTGNTRTEARRFIHTRPPSRARNILAHSRARS